MLAMSAVPGFLPSTHGLHFANRFPPGPTVRLGPFDTRWFAGVGDAANGLCGGMAWYVRERFEAGLPIPPDRDPPVNGSPLFQALVRRQVLSLEWMRTPLGFWWMGARGHDDEARRTRDSECPKIEATIASGHLAMVGLVRHEGLNPFKLTESHQALAYACDAQGGATTVRIYDPNHPDVDDITLVADLTGIRQSTGETLYGFFRL
jgi:hypothetical protein